jgi:hypothetical protein
MPSIRVVEPALAGVHNYVDVAQVNDELVFPHVDSCLAIAFLLNNGRKVGGHVGMQMPNSPNLDPAGNAAQITQQMLGQLGGGVVQKVVLVGDANWEQDFVTNVDVIQATINASGAAASLFLDTGNYGGGVDVSLNPRRGMLFIQRCTGAKNLILQTTFARIVGHRRQRL